MRSTAANIRKSVRLKENALIHFTDLSHERRVRTIGEIAATDLTISSIIVNKRHILQPQIFTTGPFRLYFYAARLLLERISWHCRDFARNSNLPNCETKIIFEHRRHLSYEALRDYFRLLRGPDNADPYLQMLTADVRIHWPAINIDEIEAAQKHDYAGLQLADCAASGIRRALETNQYGNTEHRYAKMLQPRIYAHNGNFRSYGLKFFPAEPEQADPRSHWIRKHYR